MHMVFSLKKKNKTEAQKPFFFVSVYQSQLFTPVHNNFIVNFII